MQDGVAENFTAGMLEPYFDGCGCRTANAGLSFVDPVELGRHVTRLDAEGFQVHVHAIGDRAVREALDAFEAALKENGDSDLRHHIAHLQVIHPDDVGRFAEARGHREPAGVVGRVRAADGRPDHPVPRPGADRLAVPVRGSGPVGRPARGRVGLAGVESGPAGRRTRRGESGRAGDEDAFLPEQALDLATALAAYTSGSAWLNHADETGRIEVGALADLAVLDRDPFTGPPDEIAEARVRATYVEGDCVFGDQSTR